MINDNMRNLEGMYCGTIGNPWLVNAGYIDVNHKRSSRWIVLDDNDGAYHVLFDVVQHKQTIDYSKRRVYFNLPDAEKVAFNNICPTCGDVIIQDYDTYTQEQDYCSIDCYTLE